jgi:hypothetical protein
MIKASIVFILILLFQCDDQPILQADLLSREWTHSYEEQQNNEDEYQLFRPADFKNFPASRFRKKFIFKEDGSCSALKLAPNDAHYFEKCYWELKSSTLELNFPNGTERFKILMLDESLLSLQLIASTR